MGAMGMAFLEAKGDIVARLVLQSTPQKLEHGPGTIDDGSPSVLGFGVVGWSYSNFLASTAAVLELAF